MKPLSLRAQLTLTYTAVLAAILIGFGTLTYHTLAYRLNRSLEEELEERAAALRAYLTVGRDGPRLVYDENDPEQARFIQNATRYYQVFEVASGQLVEQSRELEFMGVRVAPVTVQALARDPHFFDYPTSRGRVRFHSDVVRKGPGTYLVQVGASLAPVEAALKDFLETLLFLVPGGLVVAGLGGWLMARRVLRPLDRLATAARQIEISSLNQRLPLRGAGDELDHLAETFNTTFAKLENAVEQMKQFTASISHELRTPLTALRGEAEVALLRASSLEDCRGVLASQLEEFDKLSHMINQLLTLARAEAGEIALSLESVDLSALARSLVEQMEPVAAWKQISLKISAEPGVTLLGDRSWLERALLNLLDNAVKYTPEGGTVTLTVEVGQQDARLAVRDTGIGIPAEALPHVFERFYRVEPSRSAQEDGAGLGLSLVKWIVDRHQGRVRVESTPGEGSCFTVWLPLAPAPHPAAE